MRYFRLRLTRPEDDLLFETDFLVDQFDIFVRELASVLVQKKLLRQGERYDARILPRADNNPSFKKPAVLKGTEIPDDGQGFLDILFEKIEPPVEQITYLTTQIHSAETDIVYRFDLQLDLLLRNLLTSMVQVLLDDKILADGEHFRFYVSAQDKGRPRIDPVAVVRKPATATPVPLEVKDEGEISVSPDDIDIGLTVPEPVTGGEELEIVVESVEELIKPESKSMEAYSGVESVGQVSERDIPIFIRRDAIEQARRAADVSARADEEVGGFLVGSVFRDPNTGRLFVEINEVVEADQARGTYVSIDFDYNAWHQVLDRIDNDFPDKFPIGWYHTHLVSQAVVLPVEGSENEYIAKYVPFFSSPDLFIHRNFFPDPWHVALVMDLRCQRDVFFAWREGQIMPTQGYYLYGE